MKNILYIVIFMILVVPQVYGRSNDTIVIQSTTSTRDSGFYDYILPIFKNKFSLDAYVVAVGTGLAIKNAMNCDADILITHAITLEHDFISKGFGVTRNNLMYNDFVLIGPQNNPAKISSSDSVTEAFIKIAKSQNTFISRADDSGTHISEKNIWNKTKLHSDKFTIEWYLESGQGMGQTLNIAIAKNAYTYTDRATWLKFKNKQNHRIIYQNDPLLVNQYGIITINPQRCPNINHKGAKTLHDWLISKDGQNYIAEFTLNNEQLFIPNYK
tara:strand:- start:20795 stop:21607 length:813 start_codon:yes stop_codon:yes gene_type:complete